MKSIGQMVAAALFFVLPLQLGWAQIPGDNFTCEAELIEGKWQYYKFYYQGKFQPPANPRLILQFEFDADGTSHLHWERTNEDGYCHRKGQFSFDGCVLRDKVTWVDPENNVECAQDPDMRVGNTTKTRAEFRDGDFYLYLNLGNDDFVYIWKRVGEDSEEDKSQDSEWRQPEFKGWM